MNNKYVYNPGRKTLLFIEKPKVSLREDFRQRVDDNLDNLLLEENRKIIWEMTDATLTGQLKRGDLIEAIFAKWKDKYMNHTNLNDVTPNYKDLDFDGVFGNADEVVSLKTYQPKISTEKTLDGITKKIKQHANKLSKATLDPSHMGKNRVLDFVVKKGEWDANMVNISKEIIKIQKNLGNVTIRITEF